MTVRNGQWSFYFEQQFSIRASNLGGVDPRPRLRDQFSHRIASFSDAASRVCLVEQFPRRIPNLPFNGLATRKGQDRETKDDQQDQNSFHWPLSLVSGSDTRQR